MRGDPSRTWMKFNASQRLSTAAAMGHMTTPDAGRDEQ
jgi:hypothetical protein